MVNNRKISRPDHTRRKTPQNKPLYNAAKGRGPNLQPKEKTKPSFLPWMIVLVEHEDYLECTDSNGFVLSVAKPYALRQTPFHEQTINGVSYNYSSIGARTASDPSEVEADEAQVITPSYYAGEEIVVARNHPTDANGNPIKDSNEGSISYTDLDDAGRSWASEIEAYLRASSNLSDIDDASIARTNIGLKIDTDVQSYSEELKTISEITHTADYIMKSTGSVWEKTAPSALAGVMNHADLLNRNWAAAGHTMDATLDMVSNAISNITVLNAVTAAELSQLETMGAVTVSAAQWAYLGAMDQSVVSGATPTFTATNITGVPAASVLAGTFGTGAFVFDNTVSGITTLTATTLTDSTWSTVAGVHTGIVSLDGAGTIDLENNLDGTGFIITAGEVDIIHTATEADNHSLEILSDAAGFGDVKAIEIDYITGAIVAGIDEGVILINIDETLATGGEVFGLEILATDGSASITGLKLGPLVAPIHQDSGVFVNPTTGTDNTPSTDIAAMIDGSILTTTAIFEANSEYIIIGAAVAFQDIEFILTVGANKNIKPTFWYSTVGTHQFTQFTPVDGTDGFKHTGVISWDASDLTGHVADGVTGTFDIKIIRTRNNLTTDPTLGYAKIAATTEYTWDKNGDVSIRDLTISGTFTDGTMSIVGGAISSATNTNWDTAYGWGDHGSAGYIKADGSVPLTANWDVGNFDLTMKNLTCDGTITDGTASLVGGALSGIGSIVLVDGGTIGQAAGPLLTFNETNNRLGITGCKVGINELAPQKLLHITGVDTGAMNFNASANLVIEDTGTSWLYFMSDVEGIAGIAFGDTADTFKASIDYNHDGDYLRIYSNSAERVRIDNAGKVGIGTSLPDSILHIKADIPGEVGNDYAGQIIIQNPANDVTSNVVITAYESDASGNPDQQLWYLGSSSAGNEDIIYLNRRNAKLALGTNDTTRITILGGGNVGINTTAPLGKLHVFVNDAGAVTPHNNADGFIIENSAICGQSFLFPNNSYGLLYFGTPASNNEGQIVYGGPTVATVTDRQTMHFVAGSNVGMSLKGSGRLGIGTDDPLDTLDVRGDITLSDLITMKQILGGTGTVGSIGGYNSIGGTVRPFNARIDFTRPTVAFGDDGGMDFYTNKGNNNLTLAMRIDKAQNVSILAGNFTIADGGSFTMQEAFNMVGATGENIINVPANLPDALSIVNLAVGDLMVFDTTTGAVAVNVMADTDGITTLGRAKIGAFASDQAFFSHIDFASATSYGFKQDSTGNSFFNCANTKGAYIRVNNANKFVMFGTLAICYVNLSMNGNNITSGGSITGTTFTDGTATLTAGAITGLTAVNSVTATELSQLETIGATTISAAQWAYLGGMDQALAQASSVTFAALNLISDTAYGVGWNGDTTGAASKNALYDIISTLSGDVSAAAIMTDHAIVRGDGGAKGVQDSGVLIDDSDNMSGVVLMTYNPSGAQSITGVGDDIQPNATVIVLNPTGNYVLTSTPTIANGTNGDIIYIRAGNGEINTVTVQDQGSLGGSNLNLGAASRVIGALDVLCLIFDGTEWNEVSYANN